MTRLAAIPPHLQNRATVQPDEARVTLVAELRGLRAALSLCSGRMTPTRASILREAQRIEQVVEGLRGIADRL